MNAEPQRRSVLKKLALILIVTGALLAPSVAAASPRDDDPVVYRSNGVYLDFGQRTFSYPLDANGIPKVPYYGVYQYNPVTTAQLGLHDFSIGDLAGAQHLADWLLANQGADGAWHYGFDFYLPSGQESFKAGWISSMAQGNAMSLLTRIFWATGDHKYLQAAKRALQPFRSSVTQGGVVSSLEGRPIYEEYPSATQPPIHVLNGFMFTLLGLRDLSLYSKQARRLFNVGYRTLTATLPLWNHDGIALYSLANTTNHVPGIDYASQKYEVIHAEELDALDSIRPNPELRYYSCLWAETISQAPYIP